MPDYVVKKGDSWAKIAGQMLGDQRMFAELMRANPNIAMMKPGQTLKLPNKRDNPFVSNTEAAVSGMTNQWNDKSGNVVSPGYTGIGSESLNTVANAVANKQMLGGINPNSRGYRNMLYSSYTGAPGVTPGSTTVGSIQNKMPNSGMAPMAAYQQKLSAGTNKKGTAAPKKPGYLTPDSGLRGEPIGPGTSNVALEPGLAMGGNKTSIRPMASGVPLEPGLAMKRVPSQLPGNPQVLTSGPAPANNALSRMFAPISQAWNQNAGKDIRQAGQAIAPVVNAAGQFMQGQANAPAPFGLGGKFDPYRKNPQTQEQATAGSAVLGTARGGPPPAPSTITSSTTEATSSLDTKLQQKILSVSNGTSSPSFTKDELATMAKYSGQTVESYTAYLTSQGYVVAGDGSLVNYGKSPDGVSLPPGSVPALPSMDIKQALEGLPAISLPWGYGPPTFSQSGRKDPQTIATGVLPDYGMGAQVTGRWNIGGG